MRDSCIERSGNCIDARLRVAAARTFLECGG